MLNSFKQWLASLNQQNTGPSGWAEGPAGDVPAHWSKVITPVVHLCIVSGENMGNIIPILHETSATTVILLHTPNMQPRAKVLAAFLSGRRLAGMRINTILQEFDNSSVAAMQASMRTLVPWVRQVAPHANYRVNVTGGTTPMSLALFDAFRTVDKATAIYSDSLAGRIDDVRNGSAQPYRAVLDIPGFIEAKGHKYLGSLSDHPAWEPTLDEITPQVRVLRDVATRREKGALARRAVLNAAAQQVISTAVVKARCGGVFKHAEQITEELMLSAETGSDMAREYEARHFPWPIAEGKVGQPPKTGKTQGVVVSLGEAEDPVLKALVDCGLLVPCSENGSRYAFPNMRSALLVGGHWLEWYAAGKALDAGFDRSSIRHGMKVQWQQTRGLGEEPTNEIDLCILDRNRLLIVECKTKQPNNSIDKLNPDIFKLETIRDGIGTALSRGLLLSSAQVKTAEVGRIHSLHGIDICAGPYFKNFDQYLNMWRAGRAAEWRTLEGAIFQQHSRKTKNAQRSGG